MTTDNLTNKRIAVWLRGTAYRFSGECTDHSDHFITIIDEKTDRKRSFNILELSGWEVLE